MASPPGHPFIIITTGLASPSKSFSIGIWGLASYREILVLVNLVDSFLNLFKPQVASSEVIFGWHSLGLGAIVPKLELPLFLCLVTTSSKTVLVCCDPELRGLG